MFHHYGWDAGSGWLMLLWMVLFWGFILALGAGLLRWLFGTSQSEPRQPTYHKPDSAFDVAQQRYAHGEITRSEFQQIVQDLKEAK